MTALVSPEIEQAMIARERMRILSIGFYVCGGMGAVFASFLILYVLMFGAMSYIPARAWDTPAQTSSSSSATSTSRENFAHPAKSAGPPLFVFRIMAGVMAVFMTVGWIFAGLTIYAGRCLQKRKHKTFIYVMAVLNLFWIPHGTLLGIGTFLTLGSNAAVDEFKREQSGPPPLS